MCERDDCNSLLARKSGETIVCAYLIETNPPTIRDRTGTYIMRCSLPEGSIVEKDDLYLYRMFFDLNTGQQQCHRITPIPKVLYCVYQKILENYRKERNYAMK